MSHASTATADESQPDSEQDRLAAELAEGVLSEAFARFGRTPGACATAARHITRTTAFESQETRS